MHAIAVDDSGGKHLSDKAIPPKERLIVALDFPSVPEAKDFVETMGDEVMFYKVGLELFMAGGYLEFVEWLSGKGKKVFVDLKFFDVPQTVSNAVKQLDKYGATFATVHGNDSMLKAAADVGGDVKILAVTVLTSLDEGDMKDLGFKANIAEVVLSRAKRAIELGCDGVISSGMEAQGLRNDLGANFLIVSPGIRPVENREEDDQKRVVTPKEALEGGADYIVMGRPVTKAPDPVVAAKNIQKEIAELFPS